MKCLITGINGFAASYLAEELLKKGYKVAGTYRNNERQIKKNPEIKLYRADLLEGEKLNQLMKEFKPNFLFHLAAISSVKFSLEFPELTHQINVGGTENVLKAVLNANISPGILIVGTAEEYGIPKSVPIRENHPLNPETPYAKSKLEAEKLALEYHKKYNLGVVCTRSFTHTGPGQSEDFVCSNFAKQIAMIEKGMKEPILHVGNLGAKRDFSDVRDIVKSYILALEKGATGEVYNICSGKAQSIQEIFDIFLGISKKKIEARVDPARLRKLDIPVLVGDNSKFRKQTGWKPDIPLERTLKDLLDYWREKIK